MPRPSTKSEAEKTAAADAKRAKFKELADARLTKVEQALEGLRKLASYKPSEAQRDYIIAQIGKSAQAIHAAYTPGTKGAATSHDIPD